MYGKKTYRFRNLRKWKDFNKKQLTLLNMCVTALLCGSRAALWPFYGFFMFLWVFFISHTNLYILNVTQQCRCSPMLTFRAWATCGDGTFFCLDIILLPWSNILYLDIILLPWCNIFFLDTIFLPFTSLVIIFFDEGVISEKRRNL